MKVFPKKTLTATNLAIATKKCKFSSAGNLFKFCYQASASTE